MGITGVLEVEPNPVDTLAMHLGCRWESILRARAASIDLRQRLVESAGEEGGPDTSLVVFGSVARGEVTSDSDIDWVLLLDGSASTEHFDAVKRIREHVARIRRPPRRDATFGGLAYSHELVHRIGGSDDSHSNFTQRMLLLLESTPIGPRDAYERTLRNVLKRYIVEDFAPTAPDNRPVIPRFLHNDIARYWRTVTVDYADKRHDRGGDGWGLRAAKLRFSRKLTYASGLLMCFRCADVAEAEAAPTQALLAHLLHLRLDPPLQAFARTLLQYQQLDDAARLLFNTYDAFLAVLDDPNKRDELQGLANEHAHGNLVFRHVRELGHTFQEALRRIFLADNGTPFPELTIKYGVF